MQAIRYIVILTYVAVVYDALITIEREYTLVWKAKWTLGKLLFFSVRYPTILEGVMLVAYAFVEDDEFCKIQTVIGVWAALLFLLPLQFVVVLRTAALWERDRKIVWLLYLSVIAADAVNLMNIVRATQALHFSDSNTLLRPILACLSSIGTSSAIVATPGWIAVIAFDSLIFVLTFIKAVHTSWSLRTPLIQVLIRDGFLYYGVMLAVAVGNLVFSHVFIHSDTLLAWAGFAPFVRASYSIIGSRLLLNLRGVIYTQDHPRGNVVPEKTLSWRVRARNTTQVTQPGSNAEVMQESDS